MDWETLSTRERDALVAEKIMGWHPERVQKEAPPSYSTDLQAAWAIVAMHPRLRFVLERFEGEGANGSCSASFRDIDSTGRSDRSWWGNAATPAEAICLAALRASGAL
jgi:hypothetical protein